jgi:ribosomal protein L40E
MAKFAEAEERIFRNVYVCRRCKSKIRISNPSVMKKGKVKCRKCKYKVLRPKHKEAIGKGKA